MHQSPSGQLPAEPSEEKAFPTHNSAPIWWRSWELYLIALLAVGLRLYRIDTAQYMIDQNTFYQMAHDALAYGLWPISANRASTGPLIPPLFVYVMMLSAAITPNPVAGNVLIALCNIAAVLLTYLFVRRYYGRLAGTISALLYATVVNVIIFSRDIWQPDLLPLFVILLLFMLFRGVVEEKRHWFLPAVLLLGAMYQFHSTAVYLLAPLLVAVLLAYKTLRWRELLLTALGLLLLFAPYIYLECCNHFADLNQLFLKAKQPSHFSSDPLQFYRVFVQSFVLNPLHQQADTHLIPSNGRSILLTTPLRFIAQFILPVSWLMEVLLAGGAVALIVLILWPDRQREQRGLSGWWRQLLASPERKGLLLLLAWQSMVLVMLRHPVSVYMYIHYLMYLLPGPFILIALLLATVVKLQHQMWPSRERVLRYSLYVALALIVGVQTLASAGWLVDHARGNFVSNYAIPEYFDLATVQRIVKAADQVARQQHLTRAYIDIHGDDESAVSYLAQFAQTPMAVFNSQQCMLLPDTQSGPVVYVSDPNRPDIDALLRRYTTARLVEEIPHPGGAPFKLYVLSAQSEPQPALQLSGGVQLRSTQADVLSSPGSVAQWLATRWTLQNTQTAQPRTTYQYVFSSQWEGTANAGQQQRCELSRTWSGDQLIPFFKLRGQAPRQLITQVQAFSQVPQHYDLDALKLVTYDSVDTARMTLCTADGRKSIRLFTSVTSAPA